MMFERFVTASCFYSYCVSLTIHHNQQLQSGTHPAHIRHPILRTSGTHPAHIRHTSGTHPAYIRRTSGVHPAPNPAYFRGLILPSVGSYRGFTQVLCPRSPLLFPFLLLHILDVREICLMQYVFNNTLHQTHNLSNIRIIFYIFILIYCIHPQPNPLHFRHLIPSTSGT
jgi:hypothetical protein